VSHERCGPRKNLWNVPSTSFSLPSPGAPRFADRFFVATPLFHVAAVAVRTATLPSPLLAYSPRRSLPPYCSRFRVTGAIREGRRVCGVALWEERRSTCGKRAECTHARRCPVQCVHTHTSKRCMPWPAEYHVRLVAGARQTPCHRTTIRTLHSVSLSAKGAVNGLKIRVHRPFHFARRTRYLSWPANKRKEMLAVSWASTWVHRPRTLFARLRRRVPALTVRGTSRCRAPRSTSSTPRPPHRGTSDLCP
jgi:hypothetical protein